MMAKQHQGVTLIIVLIFLQMLAALSLYALENVTISTRLVNAYWQYSVQQERDMRLLRQLERSDITQTTHCLLPVIPVAVLLSRSHDWWEAHACSSNLMGIRYYYAVEFLGNDPCASITSQSLAIGPMTAAYYRLTLVIWPTSSAPRRLQQSTLVKAVRDSSVCEGRMHTVRLGRQSWRMLE